MDALDGLPNPFHKTIVADPWQSNADDVPEIHGEAYRLCQRRLNDVIRDGGTRSIVLYGEAGSGKTHLLRRLRAQWLGEPPHEVDPIRPEVVFVSARLQTSPHHLWRYLRKSLVDDLLRQSSDGSSQLEGILLRRLAEVRGADADLRLWFEWLRDSHSAPGEFESTLNDLIDQVNLQARLGHDLWVVLVHLLLGRHRREATAWLRGDPLPSQALDRLGLAPEPSDSEPEDQARVTVAALCRLAGRKVPVVFCFDQIEALQVDRSDVAALFAFGRMVMELFQETENVLILACVQISFIDVLREAVLKPAWDRLAMERLAIAPLRWEEASKLIVSRLDAPPALRSLRQSRRDQPLWPLDPDRLKIRIGGAETARRILGECADQFEALQLGRQPDRPTTPDLSDSWRERLEVARRTYDPDQIPLVLEHALPMLLKFVAPDWARSLDQKPENVDLLWQGPKGRIGIHLSFARDMRSVWRPFSKLLEHLEHRRIDRLWVVRHPTHPVTSPKARDLHQKLLQAGARELSPSPEVLKALDALRKLLSDAKAGELSSGGRTLAPRTVEDWLAEHLPDDLRQLAEEIVAEPDASRIAPSDDLSTRLAALLEDQPILSLSDAAANLGSSESEIEAHVRDRADTFGLIDGPPHVLFRVSRPSAPQPAGVSP